MTTEPWTSPLAQESQLDADFDGDGAGDTLRMFSKGDFLVADDWWVEADLATGAIVTLSLSILQTGISPGRRPRLLGVTALDGESTVAARADVGIDVTPHLIRRSLKPHARADAARASLSLIRPRVRRAPPE